MSYRPFAWIGTAVFTAAFFAAAQDPNVTGTMSMVCGGLAFSALMAGVLLGRARGRRGLRAALFHASLMLLAAGAALGLYADRYFTRVAPVLRLDQVSAEARMEVLDYPEKQYGKLYYPVRVLELDGRPVEPFRVRLSCPEALECEPCDQVACRIRLYSFDTGGVYSAYSSRLAEGDLLGAYPEEYNGYRYLPSKDPLPAGRLLPALRRNVSRSLDRCVSGDEAALLKTVLLGRGSTLSEGVYTDLRVIGCSHMLAVSGLHMTLVGAFMNLLLARLPIHRRLRGVISAALLFFYLALTGFPASAVRSYIMFAVCSLGAAAYQAGDTLNSLGVAVTVICFADPFSGGSLGFTLSVLATAGIALFGRRMEKRLCPGPAGPVRRYIAGTVSTTLPATIFTMPVQVAVFQGIPLMTLASNLLLLPVFVAMLYIALPLLALSLLDPAGALVQPLVLSCGLLARVLLKASHWMAGLPGVYLSLKDPALVEALILFILAILCSRLRHPRIRPALVFISLMLAMLLPIYRCWSRADTLTLAVSGDGESACVVAVRDSQAAVLSMGTYKSGLARQIISQENVREVRNVLVAGQGYHSKAMLRDIMSGCRPERVLLYGREYAGKELRGPGVTIERVTKGQIREVLPGVIAQMDEDGAKLRVWANGRKIILAFGECSAEECDMLVTGRPLPQIETEFTVYMCEEGISSEEAAMGIYSDFSLATDQEVRYVDIPYGRQIDIRGW